MHGPCGRQRKSDGGRCGRGGGGLHRGREDLLPGLQHQLRRGTFPGVFQREDLQLGSDLPDDGRQPVWLRTRLDVHMKNIYA